MTHTRPNGPSASGPPTAGAAPASVPASQSVVTSSLKELEQIQAKALKGPAQLSEDDMAKTAKPIIDEFLSTCDYNVSYKRRFDSIAFNLS